MKDGKQPNKRENVLDKEKDIHKGNRGHTIQQEIEIS